MKRKYNSKNILLFIIFSLFVLSILGVFSYGVYKITSYDKSVYDVNSDSFMYDIEGNYLSLEIPAKIYQRWDKNYYIETTQNDVTKLGHNVVIFNKSDNNIFLYGPAYRVEFNGDITYLSKMSSIGRASGTSFYKLNDRKYLIVSKKINSSDNSINAKNYLIININKNGTAELSNDEINLKTLSNLLLLTDAFVLDISKEELIIDSDNILELKKIIGSTNQYSEKIVSINNENKENVSSITNTTIVNNNTTNNNTTNNNTTNNTSIMDNTKKIKATRIFKLNSFSATPTSIVFNYDAYDPYDEFVSLFFKYDMEDGKEKTVFLNKINSNYYLTELIPDTKYSISFGYSYKTSEDEISEEITDVIDIKTKKIETSLDITKVAGSKIFYTLKYDSEYSYSSAKVSLYRDGVKINSTQVEAKLASSEDGYSSYFILDAVGNENIIKLEDCNYNDTHVDCNAAAKYVFY